MQEINVRLSFGRQFKGELSAKNGSAAIGRQEGSPGAI